jgi:zinc transport system ATP-binding protein
MVNSCAALLEKVSFSYNQRPVLVDVDIELRAGDFVSIVGPNGGGKTTLLKLMLGLLRPQRGTISILGLPPDQARRRVGYVPQHPQLDPMFPATALDVALMGRLVGGRPLGPFSRKDRMAAQECLRQVGLEGKEGEPFASLSGGQRQRTLIARALAGAPDLLLLDEPTSNLDAVAEADFYDLLKTLNSSLTIAMVSHDLGFVAKLVRTVWCVKNRVVAHPTVEVTGNLIDTMYGYPMRMVQHDIPAEGECGRARIPE